MKSETFASDSLSIDVIFASGKVRVCVKCYNCGCDHAIVVLLVCEMSFVPDCTLLQVEFAQSGEDVLFSVVCKDFFNNSRTCLLSVSEANQLIQVSRHVHTYVHQGCMY